MSALDVIASLLARISRVDMDEAPAYARASVRTAALHVERALTAAGYRIVGPDEADDEASAEEFERTAAFWGAEADRAMKTGNHDEARRCLARSKRHALCAVRRRAALAAEDER